MLIVYDSLTGNVEKFVKKTGYEHVKISECLEVTEPFILVTYTIGFGEVPAIVQRFLVRNSLYLQAVAVSGNKVWGTSFGKSGDTISYHYNVPLLLKFELSGTKSDVEKFKQEVGKLNARANAEMVEIK